MLLRFAYLAVSQAFAALRLFPMSDREKDVEILVLRHQLTVLQRHLGDERPRLRREDRAFLAALLSGLLRQPRCVGFGSVSPDTVGAEKSSGQVKAAIAGLRSLPGRLSRRRGRAAG